MDLNLNVPTGSGSDLISKTGSGSETLEKPQPKKQGKKSLKNIKSQIFFIYLRLYMYSNYIKKTNNCLIPGETEVLLLPQKVHEDCEEYKTGDSPSLSRERR